MTGIRVGGAPCKGGALQWARVPPPFFFFGMQLTMPSAGSMPVIAVELERHSVGFDSLDSCRKIAFKLKIDGDQQVDQHILAVLDITRIEVLLDCRDQEDQQKVSLRAENVKTRKRLLPRFRWR